ncbi:hypothetical protein MCAP1_002713 [Malassezia caprae]|uniref:EF-hand domain-containing protein n=1 Tax=Malassezia caprae TaxID=1381934 RepID=A0AAF0IW57_9BASI|nr:hypothetical protein MCAP1_002713 [Malassezia caprae]
MIRLSSAWRAPLRAPTPVHVRAFSTSRARASLWKNRWVRYPVYGVGSLVFSVVSVMGGLLIYDSMTYHRGSVADADSTLKRACEWGGPAHRPILPRAEAVSEGRPPKERLVIVGGGWGAVSLLKSLDPDVYEVTLVSPTNYFLFTPLLPAVAVGTVGVRSVTESLRRLLTRTHGQYVQGAAVNVHSHESLNRETLQAMDGARGLLEVELISSQWDGSVEGEHKPDERSMVYVPYDKLVIAVGSVTNNHGATGLEHTHRLKTVRDAQRLRKRLLENFEIASLPTTPAEERRRLLTFVVCGGGPTGVELAAEINDMIHEDVVKNYPGSVERDAQVHVLQNEAHILNTYAETISKFAEQRFRAEDVDVKTNTHVTQIHRDGVTYEQVNPLTGEKAVHTMPSGCTVWSVGVTMNDFTRRLSTTLPKQGHRHALKVDSQLRVLGTEQGTVYAVGDASTLDSDLKGYIFDNLDRFDKDKDGELTLPEFTQLIKVLRLKFPIANEQLQGIRPLFEKYDFDKNERLCADELAEMIADATKHMTSYPPTAQIASQEGKYLAHKLNKYASLRARDALPRDAEDIDEAIHKPFVFHSLGSIAYLGNAAAFELPIPGPFRTLFGGLVAMYAWRGVYLSEMVSLRTRVLVLGDYIKRSLWGRDVLWL